MFQAQTARGRRLARGWAIRARKQGRQLVERPVATAYLEHGANQNPDHIAQKAAGFDVISQQVVFPDPFRTGDLTHKMSMFRDRGSEGGKIVAPHDAARGLRQQSPVELHRMIEKIAAAKR